MTEPDNLDVEVPLTPTAEDYDEVIVIDGGLLIPAAIATDPADAIRVARANGHEPATVQGPHHYTPTGTRIAPHLLYLHPDAVYGYIA